MAKYLIPMFSKEERKELNSAFWKRFRSFSAKERNAEGKRINWLNYPVRIKQIYVRLHADHSSVKFSIDIQDADEGLLDLIWDQFNELKKVMEAEMPSAGYWSKSEFNAANQPIYRISWELENVSMYNKEDEPKIFLFFMRHLKGFDQFFVDFRDVLYGLLK
jgi:hypothetical protein